MAEAARYVERLALEADHMIIESNRIVEHYMPDLYVLALDFAVADFKDSARRLYTRADSYVVSGTPPAHPLWDDISLDQFEQRPVYEIHPPDYRPQNLIREIRTRLRLTTAA